MKPQPDQLQRHIELWEKRLEQANMMRTRPGWRPPSGRIDIVGIFGTPFTKTTREHRFAFVFTFAANTFGTVGYYQIKAIRKWIQILKAVQQSRINK